jgi:P4 family phage/plasmid primase-like protien
MSQNIKQFLQFYENKRLIRLEGKRPLDNQWQLLSTDINIIKRHTGNVGWHIHTRNLVLDVDPRNGGIASLEKLCGLAKLTPQSLIAQTPTVLTGRGDGGMHIYFAKDPDVVFSKNCRAFPGIDILQGNAQVLIAGCVHPDTQKLYHPHPDSFWPDSADSLRGIPPSLFEVIEANWGSVRTGVGPKSHLRGMLPTTLLIQIIEALDPAEHRHNWVDTILAVWHASGGDLAVMAHMVEWSLRDPMYESDPTVAKRVEQIWMSAREDYENPRTINSLISEVELKSPQLAAEVRNELYGLEFSAALSLEQQSLERIERLPPDSWLHDRNAVRELLMPVLSDEAVGRSTIFKALLNRLEGVDKEDLKQFFKRVEREALNQRKKEENETVVAQMAHRILKHYFDEGRTICRGPNEQFYVWGQIASGVWSSVSPEFIRAVVQPEVELLCSASEKLAGQTMSLTRQVEEYIRYKTFLRSNDLYSRDNLRNAINCANKTLWLNPDNTIKVTEHRPEDLLVHQIKVLFDPAAECPSFETMLEQAFAHVRDFDDFIRHWWEVVGYMIQPNKNIPLVCVWVGEGQNGKTTIAQIIQTLIGEDCVFATRIGAFASTKDNHATTSLLGRLLMIDDDVQSNTILSEDMLKTYSENKVIEVNPKNKAKFTAIAHVTPLLLCNNRVIIRDRSHGMWRRLDVVPFSTNLAHLAKSDLPQRVRDDEMPGVLNKALGGLRRLRARGGFEFPKTVFEARENFFEQNNSVVRFVKNCTQPGGGGNLPLTDAYKSYAAEARARNERVIEDYWRFEDVLRQYGVYIVDDGIFNTSLNTEGMVSV